MTGKHRRGFVGAGFKVTLSGDLFEEPCRNWFTPVVPAEPSPTTPSLADEKALDAERRAASAVAFTRTARSREVLRAALDGLSRI
ncbi:hypothetical protein [Saccharopolyspora phatthalungensis]|uniref:Uncharacterized protein n=1 Tax=Saccharopolyspora phatthalungensis TaxID=664693 RepID=A0A840QA34_9PSEU|nr:hypothetical protein [Saccharopolyspora phatthalungensis]MBB5157644.1 hypothetical protein [Saccharopolyspora phatthalungensis]